MPTIDELLRDYRAAILALDRDTAQQLMRQYQAQRTRLAPLMRQLVDLHRRAGMIADADRWIRDTEAAGRLLLAAEQGMAEFGAYAASVIDQRRRELIRLAAEHDQSLTYASVLGDAQVTPATQQAIRAALSAIPVEATTSIVGALEPGSPLRKLFDEFGTQASRRLGEALVNGITRGQGAEQIGRALRQSLDGDAARALTIARTETHRAYRSASLDRYRTNTRVYAGWEWAANLDTATCPVCVAQHGTVHELDEEFGSHPNCRCRPIPVTNPLSEIIGEESPEVAELQQRIDDARAERPTGEQWFAGLSEAQQREILGPKKHAAYQAGDISLADVVVERTDPEWGLGHRTASLREALANAAG